MQLMIALTLLSESSFVLNPRVADFFLVGQRVNSLGLVGQRQY